MKTNILSLSSRQVAAIDKAPAHLVGELRADGNRIGEAFVLDVRRLADTLTREGESTSSSPAGAASPAVPASSRGSVPGSSGIPSPWTAPCPRAGPFPWSFLSLRLARPLLRHWWPSIPWPLPWPARTVILSARTALMIRVLRLSTLVFPPVKKSKT